MGRKINVPISHVHHLLEQVLEQGYSVPHLLDSVGLKLSELEGVTEISAERFGRLYQRACYIAQDEYFGLLSGGAVPNGTFRMMCHCLLDCVTLEQAIYRASDFHDICRGVLVKPHLVRKGRFAKVTFTTTDHSVVSMDELLQEVKPAQVRTTLSMWQHFICWLLGTRLSLKAAYFSFAQPADIGLYRTLFQAEVKFDQHENAIVFPAYFLDYPIVQTPKTLRSFLQTAPYQLMVMIDDDASLKSQVVALIGSDFSRDLPTAENIADCLHMSVSTLRRRLLEEGTSYQQIKDDCRKAAALNYINTPQLSFNEVAVLMGFHEPSAFFRSFKKWTGMTPGAYRRSDQYEQQLAFQLKNIA